MTSRPYIAPHRIAGATRDWAAISTYDAPLDYPEAVRFVPSFTRPTFGERLVLFFRLNGETLSFWFAMFSIVLLLAAVVGAYAGVRL